MPVYCYRGERSQAVERVFPIGKAPDVFFEDGKRFKRDRAAEMASISVPATSGWPMTCYASGVNANQAGELRNHLADAGVPTEVTADGDPVYRNAKHRKKALKARGMFDKAAFV